LLLTAAGSNVGRMILKLSKLRGFSVIAVVRRPEHVAEIKALGASEVICSTTEDMSKRVMTLTNLKGVDAAIDAVGGEMTTECFKLLSDWGRMVVYGLLDKERNSSLDIRKMLFYNLDITGFWLPGWWFRSDLKTRTQAVNRTLELVQNGSLTPVVEKEYHLSQISEAVAHAERPGNSGRIILVSE
jgi:NADPH:quinone reductase-like Zn-dependent oxidoreductase